MALLIVDNQLLKFTVSFQFGETAVVCESRFPHAMLPVVTERATAMLVASGDPHATLSINDETIVGIILPPAVVMPTVPVGVHYVTPDMHPYIVEILKYDQVAFHVGHYKWEIGLSFQYGDMGVDFNSKFDSHLVPAAFNRAKAIANANDDPHCYLEQCFEPLGAYPTFTL
jgi:hypothetical protein